MAQLHNALTRGPLSNALKNLLGLTKDPGGIERFGETLTPVVDLWSRPEWQYLRSENLWARQLGSGAVPAEFSFAAVVNPLASTQIVVVTRCNARGGGASGVFAGLAPRSVIAATGTQGTNVVNLDTRLAGSGVAIVGVPVETWTGSDPGNTLGGNIEEIITGTSALEFITLPWILKPGAGFYVIGQVVNTSVQVNVTGYARPAARGELVP